MDKVIELRREPMMACRCGCYVWYLITTPEKDRVARKIIHFECANCEERIETNISLEAK